MALHGKPEILKVIPKWEIFSEMHLSNSLFNFLQVLPITTSIRSFIEVKTYIPLLSIKQIEILIDNNSFSFKLIISFIETYNNQGFTFKNCKITSSGVSQEVEVDDPRGNYLLLYQLEVDQLQLGVVAASVTRCSTPVRPTITVWNWKDALPSPTISRWMVHSVT